MRKSGFLTLCLSFVPGAGHMYQGYMKRGLSMGLLVALAFGLAMFLQLDLLVFPGLIIYMYTFFDSLNLRSQLLAGTAPQDEFLIKLGNGKELVVLVEKRHKLFGWGLVAVGVYALYQNFVRPWIWSILSVFGYDSAIYRIFSDFLSGIPNLLVGIALIWAGFWLVRRGKAIEAAEDYTQFKGTGAEE